MIVMVDNGVIKETGHNSSSYPKHFNLGLRPNPIAQSSDGLNFPRCPEAGIQKVLGHSIKSPSSPAIFQQNYGVNIPQDAGIMSSIPDPLPRLSIEANSRSNKMYSILSSSSPMAAISVKDQCPEVSPRNCIGDFANLKYSSGGLTLEALESCHHSSIKCAPGILRQVACHPRAAMESSVKIFF